MLSKACALTLHNDDGLTGWELATQLEQHHVLELRTTRALKLDDNHQQSLSGWKLVGSGTS